MHSPSVETIRYIRNIYLERATFSQFIRVVHTAYIIEIVRITYAATHREIDINK